MLPLQMCEWLGGATLGGFTYSQTGISTKCSLSCILGSASNEKCVWLGEAIKGDTTKSFTHLSWWHSSERCH